jgi:hypothetical protein
MRFIPETHCHDLPKAWVTRARMTGILWMYRLLLNRLCKNPEPRKSPTISFSNWLNPSTTGGSSCTWKYQIPAILLSWNKRLGYLKVFYFHSKGDRAPLGRATVIKLNETTGKGSSLNRNPQECKEGRLPLSGVRAIQFSGFYTPGE